ncbi:MAG: hypothetical protein EOM87_03925 [Clostridia bacterium]|nr:hypothetical protein [Clostridia bacterium]
MDNNNKEQFHNIPLTKLAASLSESMEISPPEKADSALQELHNYIRGSIHNKIDKMLIFNPDALGATLIDQFSEDFAAIKKVAPLEIPFITEFPPITNACFCTMYTGTHNDMHGIFNNRNMKLTTDTIFDALARAGKKSAIVAVGHSTMAKVFNNTAADVFPERYDSEVITKAVELIKNNEYDLVVIYNQQYDDSLHITHPRSKFATKAMRTHIAAFELLCNAAEVYWQDYNTLVGFAPDHGAHREWYGLGSHGKYIPEDMNIYHYYGIQPKQK